jgi:hypothetical protein
MPVDQTRRLVAALTAVGAPVRYTEGPRGRSIGAAQLGYADPKIVSWLLAQKRWPCEMTVGLSADNGVVSF